MSRWGPEDEAQHPRGEDGRWIDKLSTRLPAVALPGYSPREHSLLTGAGFQPNPKLRRYVDRDADTAVHKVTDRHWRFTDDEGRVQTYHNLDDLVAARRAPEFDFHSLPGEWVTRDAHMQLRKRVKVGDIVAHPEWWPYVMVLAPDRGGGRWFNLVEIIPSLHPTAGRRFQFRAGGGVAWNIAMFTIGEDETVLVRKKR